MLLFDEDERASFLELKQSLPEWRSLEPFIKNNQLMNDKTNYSFLETQKIDPKLLFTQELPPQGYKVQTYVNQQPSSQQPMVYRGKPVVEVIREDRTGYLPRYE